MNNMEASEHFEKILKMEFGEYNLKDLMMLGEFLGRKLSFFRQIYKAYHTKEVNLEMTPKLGAPIKVSFIWETKEVIITRQKVEIKLTIDLLLKYLGAIDLCFGDVLPVGSVVEIDLSYFPELGKSMSQAKVIIVGQKVTLSNELVLCKV